MNGNKELFAFIKGNPISLGCGAVALVLGVVIYLRSSDIPDATALLEQKAVEGARLEANLRNGSRLPEQLAALTAASATIDSRLIRASELAQNLQYFYKLEAETGTKLIDLRQSPTPAAKNAKGALTGIDFSVTVQGEYPAIVEFLRRLEQGGHYSRIMSANIAPGGTDRTGPLTLALGVQLLGQP